MHDLHACKTLVDCCVQDHRHGPQDTSQLNYVSAETLFITDDEASLRLVQAFMKSYLGRILHCNPVCSKDIHQILRPPSALVVR